MRPASECLSGSSFPPSSGRRRRLSVVQPTFELGLGFDHLAWEEVGVALLGYAGRAGLVARR